MAYWKPIKEFEGHYEVSDAGDVRNARSGRVLKPKYAGRGYRQVCLRRGNYRYVHRLVAQAFVRNLASAPQVNHIDGDKSNNAAVNLEWVSARENLRHAYRTGLLEATACKNPVSGSRHARSRRVALESHDGRIHIEFASITIAAREMCIDYSTIHGALHAKFNQAGGWAWKFV